MKKRILMLLWISILAFAASGCFDGIFGGASTASFTLLQTSDVHHHASGFGPAKDYTPLKTKDKDSVLGGYARIASIIFGEALNSCDPLLVVDSGDFTMGTFYDMTLAQDPISLRFFQVIDYDAVTLGNHEFDYGPDALAGFIRKSKANTSYGGFTVPIVASNMDASASPNLQALVKDGTIVPKLVKKLKNGLKVGIIGLLGPQAVSYAPMAYPVTFFVTSDAYDYAKIQEAVDELRNRDKVKIVIALSHEGIYPDGTGHDADLANNVTGIDIIASGHLHVRTPQAFKINDTLIFSPGEYGEYISKLKIIYDKKAGAVTDSSFESIEVTDNVKGNLLVQEVLVAVANTLISTALNDAGVFASLGLTGVTSVLDQIAVNDADMAAGGSNESVLGNLSADAVRAAANSRRSLTGDDTPFSVSAMPNGVIRDGIYKGKTGAITFADAYNVMPLGADPLDTAALGYPLVHIYVKAADIYTMVGLSLLLGKGMGNDFFINFSGIQYTYNHATLTPTAVYWCPVDSTGINGNNPAPAPSPSNLLNPYDTASLYRVVADLYTLMMMYQVVKINPAAVVHAYDKDGIPLSQDQAVLRRFMSGTNTLRTWQAMAGYLHSLDLALGHQYISLAGYKAGGAAMGREQ